MAKKLLLVGDEIRVLDWLDTQLYDAGFDVVVAGNGVHALAELEANGTRFAALVTAINLGSGPDGWEVRA
jgi:DNA-binding response OmpR family regulator